MRPKFRALVHEFGLKIVDAMIADGYDNADELRIVLEGWRSRRQEQWLKTDFSLKSTDLPVPSHSPG